MAKIKKSFRRVGAFAGEERGTQLVELAIVIPIFLVLLAATAEFARFYYQYTTLKSAVRAGARHASKWRKEDSWTDCETKNLVVYGDITCGAPSGSALLTGLNGTHVIVQPNGPVNKVESVTVRIQGFNYTPIFDLGALTGIPSLSMNVPISPSVTMKQLFNGPVA